MQFNRSHVPNDGCGYDGRRYYGHISDDESIEGAGFSLDLFEPRPLAPPERRHLVTDPIGISMLQMGFHQSAKDQNARFSSTLVPSQRSRGTLHSSDLASTLWSNAKYLQSSNTGTSIIHPTRLPPQRNKSHNISVNAVTPGSSYPGHVAEIQDDHFLRLESMRFDEWSLGSQASRHDRVHFKKSGSCSSSASSYGVSPCEARTVDYHSQSDEHWMEKYQELQAFFRFHGHSNVPSIFPENQTLANWVKRTRGQYKLCHQTCPYQHSGSTLTKERVELLRRVDFQMNMRAVSWQQHYEKLVMFQETNGHIRVTSRDDPSLCNWMKRQRKHCRNYYVNGEGFMTAERIQKLLLVDSGFVGN